MLMLKQLPISAYTSLTAFSSQTRKLKEFNTSSKSALKRLLVIQIQISCALTTTCTTSRVTSTIHEELRGVLCRSRTKRLTTQVCSSEITACIIYISNLSLNSCKVEIPGERLSNLYHRIYWPAFLQWLMEKRKIDKLVIKIWWIWFYFDIKKKNLGINIYKSLAWFWKTAMCTKCLRISFCDKESFTFHP